MFSFLNLNTLTFLYIYDVNLGFQSRMTCHCVYVKFTYLMRLYLTNRNTLANQTVCIPDCKINLCFL